MHPQIERMRPAHARALHILDTEHGQLDPNLPAIASVTERTDLELAARQRARALLDQPTREWLERLEQLQRGRAAEQLGLNATEPRDADEVDVTELHLALTLAERIRSAPIVASS